MAENFVGFDLIIVGGGAAGLAAGVFAGKCNLKTAIIEKMPSPGRKLLCSGGGHCNISNNGTRTNFYESFGKNGRFISPALEEFDNLSMKKFFSDLSVDLYSPDSFHVFPKSGRASDILNALLREIRKTNVKIFTATSATEILFSEDSVCGVKTDRGIFRSKKVILACGGMSYPETGSDGSGYMLAKIAGHSIIKPVPALVELYCEEKFIHSLSGLSLKNVEIWVPSLKLHKLRGEFLFTHNGISGPLILNISGEVAAKLEDYHRVELRINFVPEIDENKLIAQFSEWRKNAGKKKFSNAISSYLPRSLAEIICAISGIDELQISRVDSQKQKTLIINLRGLSLTVTGTAGFMKAMLTKGGVSLKEVNPHTLESKIKKGLFFAGEILDLQGHCGGYNLQWAFSSANLASKVQLKLN